MGCLESNSLYKHSPRELQLALAASVSRNINIPVAILHLNDHLLRCFLHRGQLHPEGRDIKGRNLFEVFATVSGVYNSNSEDSSESLNLLAENLSSHERMLHSPRTVVGKLDVAVLDSFLHRLKCLYNVPVRCSKERCG